MIYLYESNAFRRPPFFLVNEVFPTPTKPLMTLEDPKLLKSSAALS